MTKKKNKIVEKTRRKNGEGSIYQEKNGLWIGSIWIEQPDGSKKRKKVTAHSQMEVSKKLVELTGRMNALKDTMYSGKTFGELMQDWMLIFKKASVTPSMVLYIPLRACTAAYPVPIKAFSTAEVVSYVALFS